MLNLIKLVGAPLYQVGRRASSSATHGLRWYNKVLDTGVDEDLSEQDKRAKRMARNTKLGCFAVFGSLSIASLWFIWENSRPRRDLTGAIIKDKYSGDWLAYYYRCLDAAKSYKDVFDNPSRDVLLPPPIPFPYHQPKYTVVIELKDVLVHPEWSYQAGHRFKKRPALEYFLDIVGYPNFELVVYTSEDGMTAEPVIKQLDTNHKIMYNLYRDCTKNVGGHRAKDLSKLNRDLSKVIYIDFDPNAFKLNPENVLRIPKWDGNMDDTTLVDLAELLKTIFMSDVEDVRPTLQHYSQFDNPPAEFKRRARNLFAETSKESLEA